ncbi:MAG: KpsF/GutQ family sugar-phosphate isomerase [Planctomycetota bacterium]|nr:KpsF/GutQ family sugar-phosphate isomerase [Planctomycetota bacterium]
MSDQAARHTELHSAAETLRAEARAIDAAAALLDERFPHAVDLMTSCAERGGSILVSGLGKSGLIGKKISATLSSLGAPSHDIHPSEAAHGDLGRIRREDCLLALSRSGETEEVVALAALLRQDGVPIISITAGPERGHPTNTLARLATVALSIGPATEATEDLLAPTCSTTATLALGDALALAVARRRRFTSDDFARRHPGGTLGGLLRPVLDVLRFRAGTNLPVVALGVTVREAETRAAALGRRTGALLVVDAAGALAGIFTDADLRRLVLADPAALDRPIESVMTSGPRALHSASLVRDAVQMVRESRLDEIPVVDDRGRPVGLLDVQDLIAIKVVEG